MERCSTSGRIGGTQGAVPTCTCSKPTTRGCTPIHALQRAQRRVQLRCLAVSSQSQPAGTIKEEHSPPSSSSSASPAPWGYTGPFAGFTYSSGRWTVRPINKRNPDEVRRVVFLQTEGFHVSNPIPFVDSTLKTFFQAEVLSEMQKKLKYNPDDRFICLVVEEADNPDNGVVGVVEVSYIDEKEILKTLTERGETCQAFVYIASMAVNPAYRRKGVASAMMQAAEKVAATWEEEKTLLHVYQDNKAAIELYKSNGYEIIFQDNPLWAKLAVRPRYLMYKQFAEQ